MPDVPIGAMIMLLIVVAAVLGFMALVIPKYLGLTPPPVTANVRSEVYKWENHYSISIRFAKKEDTPPIGICRITVTFYHPATDSTYSATATLAVGPSSYRNQALATGSPLNVTVSITTPVIRQTVDVVLDVYFSEDVDLNSVTLFYCIYGKSAKPKWSESLEIPEVVLQP